VRDGVTLASAGHPVVVFVHDHFERAARAHATGLGLPNLNLYVFSPPQPGGSSATYEIEQAAQAVRECARMLLHRVD
jgi:hypothetical protein